MANFCLTILESNARGRSKTAEKYRIKTIVLSKLGELCANRGDMKEARKAPKNKKFVPLTDAERTWIESVVKSMIKRAGEYAYNPSANLKQLTMADFPSL